MQQTFLKNTTADKAQTSEQPLTRAAFGETFQWGVSTAAHQIEGAHTADGKGPSIWDTFSGIKGKIQSGHHANHSCDFYNRYGEDICLMDQMNIPNFRFSLAWSRILPKGHGQVNQKGIDYYNRLIDGCLERNIEPWVTLYHWDLPQELEYRGGWTNRDIVSWFQEYAHLCASQFGDRIKYWMVLNEPMVFVGAGYFLGVHAPGRRGIKSFLAATHHAALCQAEGGRILKNALPHAEIGTTYSCSHLEPYRPTLIRDHGATRRADAILNRLFIEPGLGLGYPIADVPYLRRIQEFMRPGDEALLPFEFDFIGIQNYTREMVKYAFFTPFLQAALVPPKKRGVASTVMNWEVYPPAIYHILHKYNQYPQIKKLIITENGAAFPDQVINGEVNDTQRLHYIQEHLKQVLKAKQEGVKVDGYFVWSFTDNFEWAEGYHPRFGLVYVDFETQQRIVKASGKWYTEFLNPSPFGTYPKNKGGDAAFAL
ncbi:beta-glucosidase [Adhaeribacter swui]|uniref:Beta-glucosidase n=1 Tax=Adhaeribacter swui TaxID=2086471 RepID=A0A7G7G6V9_9BACT|nr:GH1 family beta-glucosidase [Adhaeribacter swui]QNF32893.1 beta-glucosidase [Adhaeribacter swui]